MDADDDVWSPLVKDDCLFSAASMPTTHNDPMLISGEDLIDLKPLPILDERPSKRVSSCVVVFSNKMYIFSRRILDSGRLFLIHVVASTIHRAHRRLPDKSVRILMIPSMATCVFAIKVCTFQRESYVFAFRHSIARLRQQSYRRRGGSYQSADTYTVRY